MKKNTHEQTESLLNKIQSKLNENKKSPTLGQASKLFNDIKHRKTQTASFSNYNKSAEKQSKKSDSYENLFVGKKGQKLILKKEQKAKDKLHESFSHQRYESIQSSKNATKSVYFTELSEILQKKQSASGGKTNIHREQDPKKPIDLPDKTYEFQSLKIEDINGLINLIDGCVQEANYYIVHLTQKIEVLTKELNSYKHNYYKLEQILQSQKATIQQREHTIVELQKQKVFNKGNESKNQDIKGLLSVIEKLNQQNEVLRRQLDHNISRNSPSKIQNMTFGPNKSKEMFNEIHGKIEILNINYNQNKNITVETVDQKPVPKKANTYSALIEAKRNRLGRN